MSRISLVMGTLIVAAGLALAQAPAAMVASGTKVDAKLKSKLDTRHAQVGDKVTAVTTSDIKEHGIKVLPKGSTLNGHVTEVTRAESSKSPSRIGVLFDQAVTQQGQVVPLRAGIASVLTSSASAAAMPMGAPMDEPMPAPMMTPAPAASAGGGGLLGGAVGNVGATAGGVLDAGAAAGGGLANAGAVAGGAMGSTGLLNGGASIESLARASNGVPVEIAMPPAQAQAGQQAAFGSVLSTPRGDMQLNSGTNVQLQVFAPSASASGSASAAGHARVR